jgi:hypothetical protein
MTPGGSRSGRFGPLLMMLGRLKRSEQGTRMSARLGGSFILRGRSEGLVRDHSPEQLKYTPVRHDAKRELQAGDLKAHRRPVGQLQPRS